jgi:hypothetical protein
LMGVIGEKLKKDPSPAWKKAAGTLRKFALPLTRIGLAIGSYGATEVANAAIDKAIEAGGRELETAAEDF